MMALTIWQPWASLILAGAKPIEWRGWEAPAYLTGQRIAIHAGARPVRVTEISTLRFDLVREGENLTSLRADVALPLLDQWMVSPTELPLSTVLCTAVLGSPMSATRYAVERHLDSDRVDHSKWGWPLSDVEPVIPMVPARGRQGFWRWEPAQ